MTILKLSSIRTNKKKSYKVENNILYIDNEPIEIAGEDIVTWDVSGIEDFDAIERDENGDIVITITIFTDRATLNSFFSVIKKNQRDQPSIEDAVFPYKVVDGEIVWEANLEDMERMEW